MNLYKSKFITIFRISKYVWALFHSLTFEVIYCNYKWAKYIEALPTEFSLDFIKRINLNEKVIEKFLEKGFFLTEDQNEWDAINRLNSDYMSKAEISTLYIFLTSLCNFSCGYCQIKDLHETYNLGKEQCILSKDNFDRAFKIFNKLARTNGKREIIISGGEPFLYLNNLKYIVNSIKKNDQKIGVVTNLTLITNGSRINKEIIEFIKENAIKVIISLDGTRERHETTRFSNNPNDTYLSTVETIKELKKNNVKIGLSFTIQTANIDFFVDDIKKIISETVPDDVALTFHLHNLSNKGDNPMQADRIRSVNGLLELFEWARLKGIYIDGPFRRIRPFVERIPRIRDCNAGTGRIVLSPDGKLGFCDTFLYSNKYFLNSGDFISNYEENKIKWGHYTTMNDPSCADCPALLLCGYGCRFDANNLTDTIDGKDIHRCVESKIVLDWIIENIYKLNKDYIFTEIKEVGWAFITEFQRKQLYGKVNPNDEDRPFLVTILNGESKNI